MNRQLPRSDMKARVIRKTAGTGDDDAIDNAAEFHGVSPPRTFQNCIDRLGVLSSVMPITYQCLTDEYTVKKLTAGCECLSGRRISIWWCGISAQVVAFVKMDHGECIRCMSMLPL